MADANKGNKVLSANECSIWVNNELWTDIAKATAKVKANFEKVNFVGDPKTYQRYQGYEGEGSLTLNKTNSKASELVFEGFKTGNFPDIKIIAKQGRVDGKAERWEVTGVIFNELTLFDMESSKLIQQELPFTFVEADLGDKITD
jgi:hypothetical protein